MSLAHQARDMPSAATVMVVVITAISPRDSPAL